MKSIAILSFTASVFVGQVSPFASAAESFIAQTSDRSLQSPIFAAPPLPLGTGTPGQGRSDAGGRLPTSCKQVDKPLTALVPTYKQKGAETIWAATVAEHPTVWFYVPYAAPSAYGEMVLENLTTKQQTIHTVALPAQPGIVQVAVSDKATTLAAGTYYWYFSIYCQRNRDEADSSVEGAVTRQALSSVLQQQIVQALPPQKAAVFARNGIWHDALTSAAALQCTHHHDSAWTQLLQAIGLQELAQEPIMTCQRPVK